MAYSSRQLAAWQAESPAIARCLAERRPVHLVGIGGVGMAGLALHLRAMGIDARGSDREETRITEWLRRSGVSVRIGHAAGHLASSAQWLVRSPAVGEGNPEIAAARARGLPVYARGQVLPELLAGRPTVAVCGTHGKTTSSAMLVHLVRSAGGDPSFLVGGEVDDDGAVAGVGRDDLTIVEVDESDGTLALHAPRVTLLTGVEYDHMENFADEASFVDCFRRVLHRTTGALVCCADDEGARGLASGVRVPVRSYGFVPGAAVSGQGLQHIPGGVVFNVQREGEALGAVRLSVPGAHNAANALGALAAAEALGLPLEPLLAALSSYRPVRRRYEVVRSDPALTVIADYAHHPSEVRALVRAARAQHGGRIVALFQPHRYTRTRALGPGFPDAFVGVDELVLAPVYAASETPLAGGTSADLLAHFHAAGMRRVHAARDLDDARDILWSVLRPGDMVLIVGAGDVDAVARDAVNWSLPASGAERGTHTGTGEDTTNDQIV